MSRGDVQAFFERYRAAFDRFDGDAVADMWAIPCAISDAGGVTWWADDAPMRDNHRALCAHYRAAGYAHADFTLDDHVPMGDDDAFVRVGWRLTRADGSLLQAFGTGYHLRRTADGVRVLLCTAYAERLKEMKPDAAQ